MFDLIRLVLLGSNDKILHTYLVNEALNDMFNGVMNVYQQSLIFDYIDLDEIT